jgi:hypothetical protein
LCCQRLGHAVEPWIACSSPIDPPIAIICRCLPFNLLARGESAVRCAAASTSKTLPSAPRAAGLVIEAFGSRLKPSHVRFSNPSLREAKAPSYAELGELPILLCLPSWPSFSMSGMKAHGEVRFRALLQEPCQGRRWRGGQESKQDSTDDLAGLAITKSMGVPLEQATLGHRR